MHVLATFIRKMTSCGSAASSNCTPPPAGSGAVRRWQMPAASLAALAFLAMASAPAHADINQLLFNNSYDGTPGWDPASGTGFDTGPDNRIVRTNDQYEYLVTFSTDGGGDDNLTLVSTLPLGNVAPRTGLPVARWSYLPSNCTGPGSNISADGQTLTWTDQSFIDTHRPLCA